MTEPESNVKLLRFIEKHPLAFIFSIMLFSFLAIIGLGIGLTSVGLENSIKIANTFSTMPCEKLEMVPYRYNQWITDYDGFLEQPSDFYNKWNNEME